MFAVSGGIRTLPSGLLMGGLVTIFATSAGVLAVYMQRRATSQWARANPSSHSYGNTFRRTMYRAYRVKFYRYFLGGAYVLGLGLIVASGVAKLFG